MRRVEGNEFKKIKPFFEIAAEIAKDATCLRARCGAIIVKDDAVIGSGFNSPALDDETQRLCNSKVDTSEKPKYDKTCCIHAEWRAILEASKQNPGKLNGSVLYFMRINERGEFTNAGDPFCTVCSRLTLESGVSESALYNEGGADIYPAREYNLKSYQNYIK